MTEAVSTSVSSESGAAGRLDEKVALGPKRAATSPAGIVTLCLMVDRNVAVDMTLSHDLVGHTVRLAIHLLALRHGRIDIEAHAGNCVEHRRCRHHTRPESFKALPFGE